MFIYRRIGKIFLYFCDKITITKKWTIIIGRINNRAKVSCGPLFIMNGGTYYANFLADKVRVGEY